VIVLAPSEPVELVDYEISNRLFFITAESNSLVEFSAVSSLCRLALLNKSA